MPGNEDEAGVSELLWYYANYKRGQLPEPGGLLDQSGHIIVMFRVIDGAVSTVERAQHDQMEKERKRGSGGGGRGGARLVPTRRK